MRYQATIHPPELRAAYQGAIDILRDAGINHTLVIDDNQWGQNSDSILDNGEALSSRGPPPCAVEYDPQHNLLLSNHMHETYGDQMAAPSVSRPCSKKRSLANCRTSSASSDINTATRCRASIFSTSS